MASMHNFKDPESMQQPVDNALLTRMSIGLKDSDPRDDDGHLRRTGMRLMSSSRAVYLPGNLRSTVC